MMLFPTGTGLERIGVAGPDPGYLLVWDAGYWIVGAGVGLLLLLDCRLWVWYFSAKTRKKGGRQGLRLWPLRCLSQLLSKRKERMLRGGGGGRTRLVWRCVSEFAYFSPMGWPCIYSGGPTSWTVTRGPSHWTKCFLFYPISDLVQDIERVIYLR